MVTNLVTKFFQRVLKLLPALNLLENKVKLDLAANSKTYRTHSNLKLSLLFYGLLTQGRVKALIPYSLRLIFSELPQSCSCSLIT